MDKICAVDVSFRYDVMLTFDEFDWLISLTVDDEQSLGSSTHDVKGAVGKTLRQREW